MINRYVAIALLILTGIASALAVAHMDNLPAFIVIAPGYVVQAWLFETHRALGGFGYRATMVGVSALVWTLIILSPALAVRLTQRNRNPKAGTSYHEPLHVTLARTGGIALVVGLVAAVLQHQPSSWPRWTVFALWFTFGGHWVELWYLNWLRPRLASTRSAHITRRLLTWLVGGTLLMIAARITASALGTPSTRLPPWWLGGPAFLCLELLVHALPQLRGQPNFYNGLR